LFRGAPIKEMKNQFKWIIEVSLFVVCLLPGVHGISGEIYQWKDKDGAIVFSDTPPPPGVDVETREFKENVKERLKTKEHLTKPKSGSIQGKRPYRDIRVVMYMTSWCPYCAEARNFLRSLDVNLVEYDIERDKSKREEMLSKSGGSTGVPFIDVEGMLIRGYNPDAIRSAIERRRN
jgi:glutaredoxin